MRASDYDYLRPPFAAMAHRGGSAMPGNIGRENTIAAFRAAVDLGIDYIETDVHATRDGHVVAFHDPVLERVCDSTGSIADLTMAELSQVRVGGEPVPTIDEVLDTFPGVRFNIDLKSAAAVRPLVDALAKHGAGTRVCVASFSPARLWRFRRLTENRVATAAGPVGVAAASFAPWKIRARAPPLRCGRCRSTTSSRDSGGSSCLVRWWPNCTAPARRSTFGPWTTHRPCTT